VIGKDAWGAFWSPSQRCVHVDPLLVTITTDVQSVREGQTQNPFFLVFAGSESDVRSAAARWQKSRNRGEL